MVTKALILCRSGETAETLASCLPLHWAAERLETGEDALARLALGGVEIILAELDQRGLSGVELLTQMRTLAPWTPLIVLLPEERRQEAALYLSQGASEVLLTPLCTPEVRVRMEGVMARSPRRPSQPLAKSEEAILMGQSPAIVGIREQMAIVSPTEIPVLILGESGTGRGVIARQIHFQSPRNKGSFVVVNCQGVPEDLLEREFFGEADPKGTTGQVAAANGGTLFFDEVGDLPLVFQGRLVRLLKEREYLPLGGSEPRPANVRFLFASSRDLMVEVAGKRFREDLYYRIQTFPLQVPPLRERSEDIPGLARTFLQSYCRELGKPFHEITDEAMECLLWYPWPGNVRELQTRMRFCAIYLKGGRLKREDLPFELQGYSGRGVGSYAYARLQFEREYLVRLLRKHRGNINRMAQESGKQRVEIYRMLKRCGLSAAKYRIEPETHS